MSDHSHVAWESGAAVPRVWLHYVVDRRIIDFSY